MLITTTLLVGCIVGITAQATTVPENWNDGDLDTRDRLSIESMISFAPPPIAESAYWVLPDGSEPSSWEDHLGKVVVVQSWTNAKSKGRRTASVVSNLIAKTNKPEDVVLLTIHTPEGHKSAESYIKKKEIKLKTIVDPTGETCNQLGFYKTPTNFVIDRNGAVRYVGIQNNRLSKTVDILLAEPFNAKKKVKTFVKPEEVTEPKSTSSYPKYSDSFGSAKNQQGKKAPKFEIDSWISGEVDVSGKTRIVEFWATWCPPCVRSIPHMNELHEHFGDSIAIVGVSGETESKVKSFTKKTKMNYGVAVDPKKKMQTAISCRGIPLAMIISSDDIVRWQGHPSKLTEELIQQVIDADNGGGGRTFERGRWDTTIDHG